MNPGQISPLRKPRSAKAAVRIADIASEVGVSPRLVSKALSPNSANSARISEVTAEKIRKAAQRLGYLPNLTARQLVMGRSQAFGMLMYTPCCDVSFRLLADLEHYASRQGHRLMVGQVDSDSAFADKLLEEFIKDSVGRGMDGVICLLHENPCLIDKLREIFRPIPNAVFISVPKLSWADWVGSDLAEGIRLIVRHLHDTGRRHMALFQMESSGAPLTERVLGFNSALKEIQAPTGSSYPWFFFEPRTGITQKEVYIELEKLLAAHPETDAIIAQNDLIAMYVMQYLHGRGIRVPHDIAVTGFDNLSIAGATIPPLTSVDQCTEEAAARAIELLCLRLESPDREIESIIIAPKLYIRGSSVV